MGALLSFITTLSPTSSTPKLTTAPLKEETSATVPKTKRITSPKSKEPEIAVPNFWNANVPENLKTEKIPEFLRGIPERHQKMLAVPADQYHVLSWEEVTHLIGSCRNAPEGIPIY